MRKKTTRRKRSMDPAVARFKKGWKGKNKSAVDKILTAVGLKKKRKKK